MRTDRLAGITKLRVAFCKFAKAPNIPSAFQNFYHKGNSPDKSSRPL
jgi:hypothetical protein